MVSIKKNYIFNLSYQLMSIVLPLITTPYVSRVLGADGIGIYSYTQSVLTYFLLFAELGSAFYARVEIAKCRDEGEAASKLFWEIQTLRTIFVMLCLGVWMIFILLNREYTIYYLVLTTQILSVFFDISWLYMAYERFNIIVARNSVVRIISVLLIFTLVKSHDDLIVYFIISSIGNLAGNLSLWFHLHKTVNYCSWKKLQLKKHMKEIWIYFVPTIATTVYSVMDKTMLKLITEDVFQNGYYEQATKLCRIPMTLILSMDSVMGTRMAYLFSKGDKDYIKKRLRKSIQFVLFMAIPLVIGINMTIEQLVPWFLGNGYDDVTKLVKVYSPLIFFICINSCLSEQYLTPSGQRARTAKVVVASAFVNFFMNMLLIPFLGTYGAAIASVTAEGLIAFVYMIMSRSVLTFHDYIFMSWKYLAAGMLMGISIYFISHSWPATISSTFIQIAMGVCVYGFMLIIFKDEMLYNQILLPVKKKISKDRKRGNSHE